MGRLAKRFGRVIPAAVLDARAEADKIVREARAGAEEILAEARAQADAVRSDARRLGEREGRSLAEATFTGVLLAARADAEKVRAAALPAARTLAVKMAERIVGLTAMKDPAALAHIAGEALAAARARSGVVLLRVHPDDLTALQSARPALAARLAAAVELRLVADPAVGRTGCIVETPAGRLDARLETQLAALERAVYGERADPDADAERTRPRPRKAAGTRHGGDAP